MRVSTRGKSTDDLVELGLRELFFGDPIESSIAMMGLANLGIDRSDLAQAFAQPNETVEAITRLVVADGLVGSGNASRLLAVQVGPRNGGTRRINLEWEEPDIYSNVDPGQRCLEGE